MAGAVVGSFIIPAVRVGGNCFVLSIWTAWLTSKQNVDINSAVPIESRTEFLFIMHLPMVAYVESFWPCVTAINVPGDSVRGFEEILR